jgi:serine/threonine protein phosphatase 1
MRTLIIGDIHGCNKTFNAMLDKVALSTFDHLYLLGDYIDRGPDSKGVIDTIFNLKQAGYQVSCLLGNHEQMMLDALESPKVKADDDDNEDGIDTTDYRARWLRNGGYETLHSFGTVNLNLIPPQHIKFLKELPHYIETEDLILVHAGLDFYSPNPLENLYDMIWIRDWYRSINYKWLKGKTVVHGHTPISMSQIEIQYDSRDKLQAINLDGGAVFSRGSRNDYGLCCLDWKNEKLYFQDTVDEI